jgi:hypothetical protein
MDQQLLEVYKTERRLSNDCDLVTPGFRTLWNKIRHSIRLPYGPVGLEGSGMERRILESFSVERWV